MRGKPANIELTDEGYMRAFKRFKITVTYPECDILGTPEETAELVATSDWATMMDIWDPFQDTKNTEMVAFANVA